MSNIKATYKLTNPDEVEATLTLTMRVDQWKGLLDEIGGEYPGAEVRRRISNMILEAQRHFSDEWRTNDL